MSPVVLGGSQAGATFRGPLVPGEAGSLALLAGSGPGPLGSGGPSTFDPAELRPRPPQSPRTEAVDDLYT
jgi:hypothetical protein